MHYDHSIIRHRSFSLSHNMFKLCTMSSRNQTHRSSKWPSLSFSKEESEEDSVEDSEDKEEASVEEEDEVKNQSSAIPVEYSCTIRGSSLMHNVHTIRSASIMLKISLS